MLCKLLEEADSKRQIAEYLGLARCEVSEEGEE
jgi:hypothetical protein